MQPPDNLDGFLSNAGFADAKITPVAGDASFRRYFRLTQPDGNSAILMDAPPPHENPQTFVDLAGYLSRHNFHAPEIFAQDLSRGLVVIEDFGDQRMREHLDKNPDDERDIYRAAIDTLIRLRSVEPANVNAYDETAYLTEANLLTDWYMPAMGLDPDRAGYEAVWRDLLEPLEGEKNHSVTTLRDYHAENIMLLAGGGQGIIDFQDALIGHPAYDLVSLLQDARRDVSIELEAEMLGYYRHETGVDGEFGHHYALLGAQRNIKIIGIFTRLWKRDGKPRYLDFLPRMWRLLERDLEHPELIMLKRWIDTHIPKEIRGKLPSEMASA
ncbi:MAG: phosphotransferase [Sphingorhabdus sp.]